MKDEARTPSIRFAGFTDAWEQREFGTDLISIQTGTNKLGSSQGKGTPLLKMGNIQKGYFSLDKIEYLSESDQVEPDNIANYGDFFFNTRNTLELVGKGATWIGESGKYAFNSNIARFKFKDLDTIFFNYLYNTASMIEQVHARAMGTTSVAAIYPQSLKSIEYNVPSMDEQRVIGRFLLEIDTLITLHQRKYDQLVNIKKSMLEKMFPKNGELVPEVRFAGFTDAWEQRKFGDIVSEYIDPVSTPTKGYYRLGIKSHAKGTFHSYVRPGMELGTAQMHRVAANNFIVNITFGWEHAVAITTEDDAGKLVSHRFPQFSFSAGMLPAYFKYLILDEDFRHHLWLASPGGAGRNRVLKISEMLEYKFWVPSQEEQQKISILLTKLDTLITLHQRKLERLKNIKKACLSKMFV